MSHAQYCEVTCDMTLSPDCYEQCGPEPSMAEAVRQAKDDGWRRTQGKDVCPTCWIAVQMERRHGTMRPGSNNMQSS